MKGKLSLTRRQFSFCVFAFFCRDGACTVSAELFDDKKELKDSATLCDVGMMRLALGG